MSNPKISVQIGIAGLSEMRTAMRSAVASAADMNLRMRQLAERTNQRIKELEEDKVRSILRSNERLVNNASQAARRKIQIEEDYARRVERINERLFISQRQYNERSATQSSSFSSQRLLGGVGHLAQAAGFYRTGHLIRGLSNGIGIGSSLGGAGEGAAAAGAGLAGVAAVALPAAAALGAIIVASKLVEISFQGLVAVGEHLASSFLGAISQIGGARNLQDMLVEGAGTETAAAFIAANAADKISTKEVLNIVNNLSKNSKFKPEDVAGGMRAFVGKTGEAGLFGQIGSFATELSTVSGMSMEQTGGLLGQLRAQFHLGPDQIKQAAASLWMQSRAGTVMLNDAPSISQALGFSRMAGKGDIMKGMSSEMGAVQLAQKGLGGTSADEAVTAIRRFQEDLTSKNAWKIQNQIGGGPMTGTDASGNRVFTNFQETLARSALTYLKKGTIQGVEERAMRVPRGIAEYAAQTEEFKGAKTDKDKLKVIEDIIEKYSEQTVSLDELDGKFKDFKETIQYKAQVALNKLAIELESELLPILKDFGPAIQGITDALVAHKGDISSIIKDFIDIMKQLVPAAFLATEGFLWISKAIGEMVRLIGAAMVKFTGGMQGKEFLKAGDDLVDGAILANRALDDFRSKLEHWSDPEDSIQGKSMVILLFQAW